MCEVRTRKKRKQEKRERGKAENSQLSSLYLPFQHPLPPPLKHRIVKTCSPPVLGMPHSVGKRVNRPEDLSLQYPHAVHRQWPWLPACLTHSRTNTHTYTGKVLKKNRGERFWWLVGPRDSFFVSAMILSIPLSSLLLHRKQTSILLQFSWTRITRMHAPTYNVAERKGHSAALRSLLGTQWPEGAWVTHKSVQLQNPTRPQKHTNRQRSQKDAPLSDEPANGSSSASCLSPKLKLQSLHLYI